jgi:hypothetical protein
MKIVRRWSGETGNREYEIDETLVKGAVIITEENKVIGKRKAKDIIEATRVEEAKIITIA